MVRDNGIITKQNKETLNANRIWLLRVNLILYKYNDTAAYLIN